MLEITDFIGIGAFALSGFLIGAKKGLDILGVIVCSFLTALGGGIIRDILANEKIAAFNDILPGLIVIIVLFIAIIFNLHKKNLENNKIFVISDSLGLVSFSISGAVAALDKGYNIFGIIFLGFVTAVGGGMLRDMLINEIPFVLKEKFYASVSIIISVFLYFFGKGTFEIFFIFVFGLFLRIVAYEKNWNLPKINI